MTTSARQLALLLLLALPFGIGANEVSFRQVTISLSDDDVILLDAEVAYELGETVSEALDNGVPLTFETNLSVAFVTYAGVAAAATGE